MREQRPSPTARLATASLVFAGLASFATPTRAHAQAPSPKVAAMHEAYDRERLAELEAREPRVDDLWQSASAAQEQGRLQEAIDLYTAILDNHPDFDHALRRRCNSYTQLERYSYALEDCEAAYALSRRPENAASLARVLAYVPEPLRKPTRAKSLAEQSLAEAPKDYLNAQTVCSVAAALADAELLARCTNTMAALAPDTWETQLMVTYRHASRGELGPAREALDRAHAAGLDDATYEQIAADLVELESPLLVWGRRAGLFVLAWIALAAFLVGAGFGLSRMTLAEAESVIGKAQASAAARDSRLHRAYAAILWLCCAYYYVSIPIILVLVLALGGGLLWLIFSLPRIPVKLVVVIVVLVFGTIFAVLKSFFTRGSDELPGEALDLREAPGLRALLDEVAAKVGTRPVDAVHLCPGAEIAVFERGGLLAKLRGKGERYLLLGVAVLDGLDTDALRAILAHEYGHFSNEDTAGGNFALGVRRSVLHSAMGLAEAGAAGWYNPAWLFLNGFHRVFLRISQGASRLQEVLADRWAARIYGAASFERGLRHAIAADLRFDNHVNASLREVLEQRRGLRNLYHFKPSAPTDAELDDEAQIEAYVNAEPSPYDSHPRPADRFRWVRALSPNEDEVGERTPAWSLFSDRAAIEERMTREICARVTAQTGMVIPAADDEHVHRQRMLSPED